MLEFSNVVPDEQLIDKLADRIVAEEQAGVLAWMLEGAAMLQVGGIPQTPQHRRLVEKWRVANNSALLFLLDATACELNPAAEAKGEFLYDAYRPWAMANGLGVFGRNGFFEAIEDGAGKIGVQRVDHGGIAYFRGGEVALSAFIAFYPGWPPQTPPPVAGSNSPTPGDGMG